MPSVGELSMRMSADSRGLVSGFASATSALQSFDARANATSAASEKLSRNFEKLSRAAKTVGAVSLAVRELSASANGGTQLSEITNKVQDFAQAAAIFGGPKVKAAALVIIGIGEAVKFADRAMNSLSDAEKAAIARQEEMAKLHKEQRASIEGTIAALQKELDTYGMTSRQLEEYALKKQNATAADLERAAAIRDQLDALDAEKKALEDAAKAEEDRFKDQVKYIEEISKRRQEAADAIAEFIAARDEMAADAAASYQRSDTPGIVQFGSQEVFSRMAEISSSAEQIDKETLDEIRKQTKLFQDLVRKLGGDNGDIQEAVFP